MDLVFLAYRSTNCREEKATTLTTNFNNIIMRMGQTSISKKQTPMSNLHLAGKEQILLGT